MDDLISRAAVLDAFMRTSYIAAEDRLISVAVIKALPTAQPQWIPCSERLPEKFSYCIVSECSSVWFARFENGEFHGILSGHVLDSVVAWMPLPEPYKEGQDE